MNLMNLRHWKTWKIGSCGNMLLFEILLLLEVLKKKKKNILWIIVIIQDIVFRTCLKFQRKVKPCIKKYKLFVNFI